MGFRGDTTNQMQFFLLIFQQQLSLDFQSVTFFWHQDLAFVMTSETGAAVYGNGMKKISRMITRISTWFPEQYRILFIQSIYNTYFNVYSCFRFYKCLHRELLILFNVSLIFGGKHANLKWVCHVEFALGRSRWKAGVAGVCQPNSYLGFGSCFCLLNYSEQLHQQFSDSMRQMRFAGLFSPRSKNGAGTSNV